MPNDKIEHTQGGTTTRDATDLGVPMTPGADHQGPEDALDPNARGDYTGRIGDSEPHQATPVSDVKPGEPNATLEKQQPGEGAGR